MNTRTTYSHDYYWPRTLHLPYKYKFENKNDNSQNCKLCSKKPTRKTEDKCLINTNENDDFLKHPYMSTRRPETYIRHRLEFGKSEYQDVICKLGRTILNKARIKKSKR